MPIQLRRVYLDTIRERYKNAPKKQKKLILDEFCTNCGGHILSLVTDVEKDLPFKLLGFACDNGTEFLNHELHDYLVLRDDPVAFVRRRPYKKNDAAHVEQKNFTHVRELFGYQRLDTPEFIRIMNETYRVFWNPLRNFFTPNLKLIKKERVGSKIKKTYDAPKTPYQRLLESSSVSTKQKQQLREVIKTKNPFYLKEQLESRLKIFIDLIDERNRIQKLGTG